jgi:predicted secreted protein
MPAKSGRSVLVYYTPPASTEEVALGALKSKEITFQKDPIDITTDDDAGFRAYLGEHDAMRSCEIKASGLLKDRTLLARILTQEHLTLRFVVPDVMEIEGSFKMTTTSAKGEMESAVETDYSFSSSGAFTIGAAS